nr:cilia- and flagella-associated protein 20-like [Parasteatoda tepidariorum]
MFRNKLQTGLITLLSGNGLNPLAIWGKKGKGYIKRITDDELQALVVEITAVQFVTTYVSLPRQPRSSIGVRLPYLTLIIKYLKLPFCFEFAVLDSRMVKRRFRASNCQSKVSVTPLLCHMPLALDDGWNKIQINLATFTKQAYDSQFIEFVSIEIYANCRVRLIYFSDRIYSDEELPLSYKACKRPGKSHTAKGQRT